MGTRGLSGRLDGSVRAVHVLASPPRVDRVGAVLCLPPPLPPPRPAPLLGRLRSIGRCTSAGGPHSAGGGTTRSCASDEDSE